MEKNKILVTFSSGYAKELEHVKSKRNKSRYIAELVRKDLEKEVDLKVSNICIEDIKEAMRSVLAEVEFVSTIKPVVEDYTEEINKLFDL